MLHNDTDNRLGHCPINGDSADELPGQLELYLGLDGQLELDAGLAVPLADPLLDATGLIQSGSDGVNL